MKFLITVGLALALLSIEAVVVKYLGLAVTRVDVTLILVVFLALRAGTLEGAFSSFVIGHLLDLMSGRPTGLYTFLSVLVFLLARLLTSLVDVRSIRTFALFVLGATFGHGLLAAFFIWLVSDSAATSSLSALPLQATLTVLASFALYPLLRSAGLGQERQEPGLLR